MVERINRFIKSSLTKIIQSPENWKNHLQSLQYVINNTVNSSVKASPSRILFCIKRKHSDRNLKLLVKEFAKTNNNPVEQRDIVHNVAAKANERLREYNKWYYNKHHKKPTIYNEGDYVLVRDLQKKVGRNNKLKPNYKDLFVVAKCLDKNRYVVKDIPSFNITQKPYNTILSPDKLKS